MVNGNISAEPRYLQTTAEMNPCTELIVDRYGANAGTHARTAIVPSTSPTSTRDS